MSAEENKAVIRRAYDEMWNGRNVDAVDELVTEDFLNHPAINQQQRGRQNLKDVIHIFEKAFPDFRYEVEDMVAEGDKVAVRDVFTGTHEGDFMGISATGNQVTMQMIHIYRFEDGRIAEHWAVRDELGMMAPAWGGFLAHPTGSLNEQILLRSGAGKLSKLPTPERTRTSRLWTGLRSVFEGFSENFPKPVFVTLFVTVRRRCLSRVELRTVTTRREHPPERSVGDEE